jgi:hypothetical protein
LLPTFLLPSLVSPPTYLLVAPPVSILYPCRLPVSDSFLCCQLPVLAGRVFHIRGRSLASCCVKRRRRSKRPKVGSQNHTKPTSLQSITSKGGKRTTMRTTDGRRWGLSQTLKHSPGIIIGCCIRRVLQLLIKVLIEALCHHSSVSLHSYMSSLSL